MRAGEADALPVAVSWDSTRLARVVAVMVLVTSLLGCASSSGSGSGASRTPTQPGPWDWPSFGHDAQHTFHGRTTLTAATAPTLKQAWFLRTGDAVTATPTVVRGTVYVGSWDDQFYAVDLATGHLRWKTALHRQDAITPYPGQKPRDATSDGGLVTSSAWFEPGSGSRPDLVIFGGGYTLYALEAATGHIYWSHAYTSTPGTTPDPAHDDTRIYASPVVVAGKVIAAVDADGGTNRRGYVFAADVNTGKPVWVHETDADGSGKPRNDGCGSVWSSPTVLPAEGLVVLDAADCHFKNPPPVSESVFALRIATGQLAWSYRPTRHDVGCDLDFGATVNAGLGADGKADFLGVGSKDGTYYRLDASGHLVWRTNVVFGGISGGFVGSAAYDGTRVYASTAIGDFGGSQVSGQFQCAPGNPRDVAFQEPSIHAFDATTGAVVYGLDKGAAFGATTVAGGLRFSGLATRTAVEVRAAATGSLVATLPVAAPCWSGIATVGDAVVFGTGASQQGSPAGIEVFTPGGHAPVVPTS